MVLKFNALSWHGLVARKRLMTYLLLLTVSWQRSSYGGVVAAIGMNDPLRLIDVLNTPHLPTENKNSNNLVEDCDCDVQELYIQQRLNHFAPSQGHVFSQRYFYSDRFVNTSQSQDQQQYAFLCVGGEGPALDKSVLVDSVHCSGDMLELAAILHTQLGLNVHLFALEHRYYGESFPTFQDDNNKTISPVTNENLAYLSSRQALGDLGHFVEAMATQTNQEKRSSWIRGIAKTLTPAGTLPPSCKWVTYGGSYPGMLAGWARLKYPHLIHAAVSNSAPIQAEVDFPEYNNRVAFDLTYDLIGGSAECLRVFQEGHQQLVDAVEGGDEASLDKVAKQFSLCDASSLKNKDNARVFLGDGVLFVPAQANDPVCDFDMCNIDQICSFVEKQRKDKSAKSSWEILADVGRKQRQDDGECNTVDWQGTLDYIASPEKAGELRSWLWQTCTEFGFYITCEFSSDCPYAKGYHSVQQDLEICSYAFGISGEEVYASVQQTLEYYGDQRQLKGGSRILSVNGNVDPWSTLARIQLKDVDESNKDASLLPVYNVEGASHHFWTHKVKETDGQNILEARALIYRTVMDWLELDSGHDMTLLTS